jgi:hypothetical protein
MATKNDLLIRLEGSNSKNGFIRDVYIDGYVHSKAINPWKEGKA